MNADLEERVSLLEGKMQVLDDYSVRLGKHITRLELVDKAQSETLAAVADTLEAATGAIRDLTGLQIERS